MPSTINGIGTTYYGKGNLNTRSGVCEHCKSQAAFSSYETRLWFVVLFIPIIPLGKKQILDQCSACTRHRIVPLGEWERVRDEATDEVAAQAERDPNDPEAAMEMLATLVGFQKHQEAMELADGMVTRFSDHADVQFQLGAWYETAGQTEKADACFERALRLEPENRAAARAVGIGCIAKGDLARARKLLSFMESPGSEHESAVLVLLADAFQAADDHQNAAELYRL
ncbi:MAG: tetratricopeptide repeat protein, partial [Planctomycetes bacterium]|nr:tetratricopeptide repeat protein [Planctomycetota bacterium]